MTIKESSKFDEIQNLNIGNTTVYFDEILSTGVLNICRTYYFLLDGVNVSLASGTLYNYTDNEWEMRD